MSDGIPSFEGPLPRGYYFGVDEIEEALSSFPRGTARGMSGLVAAHLQGEKTPGRVHLLQGLTRLCSDFA